MRKRRRKKRRKRRSRNGEVCVSFNCLEDSEAGGQVGEARVLEGTHNGEGAPPKRNWSIRLVRLFGLLIAPHLKILRIICSRLKRTEDNATNHNK